MPEFKLQAPFVPKGDQPSAINDLVLSLNVGNRYHGAARRHWHRQNLHDGQGHRGHPKAHPGDGAQQDPGRAAVLRVQGVLSRERGRVLRQLLRLLPARSLCATTRSVYREGLGDQRGDRPAAAGRHQRADEPAGCDHRGLGLVHLRPGQPGGLWQVRGQDRRRARLRRREIVLRMLVAIQYERNDISLAARQVPRARRHAGSAAGLHRDRLSHRVLRR